ncbi:Forkhead box protein I3 [Haplosporangium bisporale]|nr:Forkhead box protein I3 [Haplosporangium bisporale]
MPSRSGSTATGSTSRHSYTSPVSSVGEQEKRSLFLSKVSTGAKATKTTSTAATKASSPTQSKSGSRGGATGDLKTTRRRRRPNESYSIIIVKAIQSSQYQRLKLSEIYNYVSKEIPHMGNDKGWQNTVRHNLSHMKCFKRIMAKDAMLMGPLTTKEDTTDPPGTKSKGKRKAIKKGKGGYWILVPEHLEETSTQIRPKKNSMDHTTGSSASTPSSLALKGTGASSSPPAIGAPKRKSQDRAIPTHHQHRPPPLMMDHRGSLAGASSLWAQPRFPESHSFSQHPQSPPTSSQPHSHPGDRDMDVDKDVASMEIASMAIADTSYLQGSPYYPPGQHSSSRPTQSYARLPGVSQQQQSYPASSPSYSQCVGARGEEGEERLATCLSSPMSARSSRGSEEEDLDDDEDEDDDEEDEEEEYDEGEDSDDRSTGSRKDEGGGDARLGAGMSIHQLLN